MAVIECSDYLRNRLDQLAELLDELNKYFDDASLLATDVTGKSYHVSRKEMSITPLASSERGVVARCLKHGHYFEYSFNQDEDSESLSKKIIHLYEEDALIRKESHIEMYDTLSADEEMIFETSDKEVKKTNLDISDSTIMEKLMHERDRLLEKEAPILAINLSLNNAHVSKIFISKNKELIQGYMYSELSVSLNSTKEGRVESGRASKSGMMGLEVLSHLEALGDEALKRALEMLEAKPLVPGVYDIITAPDVSGLIAHEAFGHGMEMDMFVKNRALASSYMGQRVASDVVTMIDGARGIEQGASYLFDDEGHLGTETFLIKNGILHAGINDDASAKRLGVHFTGNGRRESFERKAYSRMTNTYFSKGTSSLEEMIASMDSGLLLEGLESGMEDPKHWGIQCMISCGREIKDGKLTGKVYGPIILTGYVPDLLMSISMVSDDLELECGGVCGKGHKERVKVSQGGPYLKAKARLG